MIVFVMICLDCNQRRLTIPFYLIFVVAEVYEGVVVNANTRSVAAVTDEERNLGEETR